ncbi:hypothetical protein [Mucilaginibacter antarcticus]|uniref:hypothetical protein n=1 Tax=Mucilaginibacter antarcticus TaxID=1855725 RepID=UPI00363FD466
MVIFENDYFSKREERKKIAPKKVLKWIISDKKGENLDLISLDHQILGQIGL